MVLGEEISADEDRHAPGDLAHGLEERQAVVDLHRLVGDAGGSRLEEGLGKRPVCGEVQLGEEELALAQEAILRRERLLDLHHEVALAKTSSWSATTFAPAA